MVHLLELVLFVLDEPLALGGFDRSVVLFVAMVVVAKVQHSC